MKIKFGQFLRCSRTFVMILLFLQIMSLNAVVDFDTSLKRHGQSEESFRQLKKSKKSAYRKYKALYERNIEKKCALYGQIPKIIHQIWIGEALPEELAHLAQTWQNMKGWTYKLWTEADILQLGLKNIGVYQKCKNPAEKSDIARLEILHKFGGVYVDTDFECLSQIKLEELSENYDVVLGIEPLEHNPSRVKVGNAFIMAAPSHPFLAYAIDHLTANFYSHFDSNSIYKAGPEYLDQCVNRFFASLKGGILLPTTYVYPYMLWDASDLEDLKSTWHQFIKSETLAIHYWTGTWLWDKPKHLDQIESADKEQRTQIFTEIYKIGLWGKNPDGSGNSGQGSQTITAKKYLDFLQEYLASNNDIKNIVDIGCGDFVIFKNFDWYGKNYLGIDVVDNLIIQNQHLYKRSNVDFIYLDAIDDSLPEGDLLLCKDVLMHLPNKEILRFLEFCKKFKHCILVNDLINPTFDYPINSSIRTGDYRCIDLKRAPFFVNPAFSLTYEVNGILKEIIVLENY